MAWRSILPFVCVMLFAAPAAAAPCGSGNADGDGLANVFEDSNLNGNCDDDDSDGDGVPNYLDCRDGTADPNIRVGAAPNDSATSCMRDEDGDDYGDAVVSGGGGLTAGTDCDDGAATRHPGATEIVADGVDQDCDANEACYQDLDNDGFGTSTVLDDTPVGTTCAARANRAAVATDCNDASASQYPGATEVVADGIDQDCDASEACYQDLDDDGYGTSTVLDDTPIGTTCAARANRAAVATDCNDASASQYPGATEVVADGIDQSCNGSEVCYADGDGDGFGGSTIVASADLDCADAGEAVSVTDCNDANPSVRPSATETCNSVDDDCDGVIDDDAADAPTWHPDVDGDTYGSASASVRACIASPGYVASATDCDDARAAVHPGATETCNAIDDDCDTLIDDADTGVTGRTAWYADADADGFGDPTSLVLACSMPAGRVTSASDCDDTRAAVHPGATETCNAIDDDCDALIDDADAPVTGRTAWYADADADGFGSAGSSVLACTAPAGRVASATDCDDTRAAVHPGATEICNGLDDDCDALLDDADGATGTTMWHADADADGFGDPAVSVAACAAPSGHVLDATDCDDSNASVSPADAEVCNGVDDDCDGSADEAGATGASTFYADADADGYGDASASVVACTAPAGHVADATDCDDASATVSPAAIEICNDVDDDCDGLVDGDDATDAVSWWADDDGDGYGDPASEIVSCVGPAGYIHDGTDCDDARSDVSPAGTEECDGVDQDCDGTLDDEPCSDDAGVADAGVAEDAAVGEDAMVAIDAGARDASIASPDAGGPPPASGGCSCRAAGSRSGPGGGAMALVSVALLVIVQRAGRRRSTSRGRAAR